MSLSSSWSGGLVSCSVSTSSSQSIDSTAARTVRVVCLSATCSPARSGCSDIQQTVASMWRPAVGGSSAPQIISPRPTSRSSASWIVMESGGIAASERAVERLHGEHGAAGARGHDDDLVAGRRACRPPPCPRSGARAGRTPPGRITHCTGIRNGPAPRSAATSIVSRCCEQRRAVVPLGRALVDDVVAVQGGDRERAGVLDAELGRRARRTPSRSRGSGPRSSRRGPSC